MNPAFPTAVSSSLESIRARREDTSSVCSFATSSSLCCSGCSTDFKGFSAFVSGSSSRTRGGGVWNRSVSRSLCPETNPRFASALCFLFVVVNVKMQKLQKVFSNKANKMSSVVLVASLTRSTSSAKVFIPCKLLTTLSVKSVPYVQLSAIPASALSFLFTSTILGTTLRMFSWTYHSPTVGSLHVAKKKSLVTCPTVWHLMSKKTTAKCQQRKEI